MKRRWKEQEKEISVVSVTKRVFINVMWLERCCMYVEDVRVFDGNPAS
jgi:hypothetical protein